MSDYRPAYLESSALVKLIVPEAESRALWDWLDGWPDRFTSTLAQAEILRTLRRKKASAQMFSRAEAVLAAIEAIHVDRPVMTTAGQLKDPLLRTLDAIHLASALAIGDLPEAFVTYDSRLARAARRLKMAVVAPGT